MSKGKIQVELQEWMGSDAAIANAAWNSTYDKARRDAKYDDPAEVEKIVRRMAAEGHQVPFESVIMRFWVRMPIMTDRQHMTHRIASHNGLSGRYRTMPDDWYSMPADVTEICKKATSVGDLLAKEFDDVCLDSVAWYQQLVRDMRVAEKDGKITNEEFKRVREFARGVMPVAGMIERTTIMNLVSFANYQRLRNHGHAQPEVRQVARLMLREVLKKGIAPVAMDAVMEQGFLLAKPNQEFEVAYDEE